MGNKNRDGRSIMTDRIALGLGIFFLAALGLDLVMYGSEHLVFLGKKFFEFTEWLAFWR